MRQRFHQRKQLNYNKGRGLAKMTSPDLKIGVPQSLFVVNRGLGWGRRLINDPLQARRQTPLPLSNFICISRLFYTINILRTN